ncbi:MAG TPA: dTDP-4-dehydrorhamnose 3,5-epimerase family protein [Acidimicrobiales bacterium]|nr:dTDP-4-dehydrorhamnose 3,5-epimerase family protein [Acidimicrobiales bacterium]
MHVEPLPIAGAWVFTPVRHGDERGSFLEWYRADVVAKVTGRELPLAQANHSRSARGVVRGLHYADVPPGQAKYVYCPRGALLDVVADIRVGSPTFGQWAAVRLDDVDCRGMYLAEGLAHGFASLEDGSSLTYLCTTPYNPAAEHTVDPLDASLGIDWGVAEPLLSPRDREAPSLVQAGEAGLLPAWDACLDWYDQTGQAVAR